MRKDDSFARPEEREAPSSLWRELADGAAATPVKVLVSAALAPAFAGAALLLSYGLALAGWGDPFAPPKYPSPTEEMVAVLMVLAGLAYAGAVAWIGTRRRPAHGPLWGAILLTLGIVALTAVGCVWADESLHRFSAEVVIGGLVCLAIGLAVLTWVQAARRYRRAVPMRDRRDGTLDVRCPSCGYRMVGLHESRCPECGTAYTLDELLARQHFLTRDDRSRGSAGGSGSPGTQTPPSPAPPPPPSASPAQAPGGPANAMAGQT